MHALSKKKRGYLRFLNSFTPSISVTYSNPFSMRALISSAVVAVLQIKSVSFDISIIFKSCLVEIFI